MQKVLEFNRPAIEGQIEAAARYLDISGGFDRFFAFVGTLNDSLGIPKTLTALGVKDPDIDKLVASALQDPSCGGNPIELTQENTTALLIACL